MDTAFAGVSAPTRIDPTERPRLNSRFVPDLSGFAPAPRHPLELPKNRTLFWEEDEPASLVLLIDGIIRASRMSLVLLIDGIIRASRISENGARQILTFFYPGEIVGLDPGAHRIYTAETVTTCRVQRFRRMPDAATADVGAQWADVLSRVLGLLSLIAQKPVVSRVASLLLELRDHLPPSPERADAIRFDVPRADIADHLGTAVETVCRTLTDFRCRGLIEMPTRHLLIVRDPATLTAIAHGDISAGADGLADHDRPEDAGAGLASTLRRMPE